MKAVAINLRPWIAGTVVAFAGVGVARLLANRLVGGPRASAMLAGYLLVILGLFIIARGVSRRLEHAAKHAPPS